jgi:hypothetical protein
MITVAILLIHFTGPGGQRIDVNPAEVTSVREPRAVSEGHLAKGTNCLIGMTNGKFIAVTNDCEEVRRGLRQDAGPCVMVCGHARELTQ